MNFKAHIDNNYYMHLVPRSYLFLIYEKCFVCVHVHIFFSNNWLTGNFSD